MKKLLKLFINFWIGIWKVVKSMSNWKGVVSLFISFLVLSGAGVSVVGIFIGNKYLIGLGATIYGFWLLPLTPLTLLTVAVAMLMQRFIFQDRNVSWKNIKAKFKEAFSKDNKDGT